MLDEAQRARYDRHLRLEGFGRPGQERLFESSLVLGAGGLGSPALLYLAAAGVGRIGIIDDDVVDSSNLQRQVIHRESDVGSPKVKAAARAVGELNSDTTVESHDCRFDERNARELVRSYDLVLDGHCLRGGRSVEAAGLLKRAGFARIAQLDGGYLAWRQTEEGN